MIKFIDLTRAQIDEICEAFAKREGIPEPKDCGCGLGIQCLSFIPYERYDRDKNAMGRIIEGMQGDEPRMFISYLHDMVGDGGMYLQTRAIVKIVNATAQQQFVAAAMALGLLEDKK